MILDLPVTSDRWLTRTFLVAGGVVWVAFNAVFALFFVLFSRANDWAAARSEATGGFDPSQLLPHGGLMWLAAHAAVGLLLLLDAAVLAAVVVTVSRYLARPRRPL